MRFAGQDVDGFVLERSDTTEHTGRLTPVRRVVSDEPVLTPALLPAIVFAVCGIYAYATGSFWDLAAVITPVVLPLALALGADPILARISPVSSG